MPRSGSSKGLEAVKRFIAERGVEAEILEFSGTVESVEAASRASGYPPGRILKTLIVKGDDEYYAVIIRGDRRLNLKKLADRLGLNDVRLAKPSEIRELLGVGPGEVSPLMEGISRLHVLVDSSVLTIEGDVLVGGGTLRHLVRITPHELLRVLSPSILDVSG